LQSSRPEESHLQESLFMDTDKSIETRSIGCSDRAAELCVCVEEKISSLSQMLSELYTEDEDPWALKQHQGNCCNNFITKFVKFVKF